MPRAVTGTKTTNKPKAATAAAKPTQPPKELSAADIAKKLKAAKLYKAIRQDLLDQLGRNGTTGRYYTDLVEDYMSMWVSKCLAVQDIQERGIIVDYNNGGGQVGKKKNDSVDIQIKVNAQMLKVLAELDIKPSQGDGADEDDL